MGRKNRNRQEERSAPGQEERSADEGTPATDAPTDQVSEAVNPGISTGHKTQKHKEKRFGHN